MPSIPAQAVIPVAGAAFVKPSRNGDGLRLYGSASGNVDLAPSATGELLISAASVAVSVFVGNGVTNASPLGFTLQATGGSGSNIVAANTVIAPGRSTGNATPASVVIQSTVAGSSGSAAQTLVDAWKVSSGHLFAATDNTYDIGASGATRPRNVYAAGFGIFGNYLQAVSFFLPVGTNLNAPSNGVLTLNNGNQTDFNLLQFGGTTASFPAIKRSSTTLQCRLADDSAYAPFACASITLDESANLIVGTTTGTKIGTATGQKVGFWNATPVVQQVLATGAGATVDNVISLLQTLGLCKQS